MHEVFISIKLEGSFGGGAVWWGRASCSLMRGEQCQTSGNSFSKGIHLFEFENDSEFNQ